MLSLREGSRVVRWIGDDAAVVRAGGAAAVSTDVMVDGTHFRLGQATPEDAGWRALAGALSDVAAMGAEPGEAYLSVVLPPDLDEADVVAVHRGAEALAAECGRDDRRRRPRARAGADARGDRGRVGRRARGPRRPRRRAAPATASA